MSKIKLYIATSLDGFIAKLDNSLDWLTEFDNPEGIDHGYKQLLEEIDTIIMGRKTYQELLNFDIKWPYSAYKTYIVSSDKNYQTKTKNTQILTSISYDSLNKIKNMSKKSIWLVGGGELIASFLELDLIDTFIISIVLKMLGKGIKLFPRDSGEKTLKLDKCQSFATGITNLHYTKIG